MNEITGNHFQAMMPVILLAFFGLVILLLDAFQKGGSRQHLAWIAIAGFVSTFISAFVLWHQVIPRPIFSDMAYMDGFTQAFTCIFSVAGILTCLLAREYLKSHDMDRGEFYVLLLFAVLGMILVASSGNLLMVFIGLETMSISAYVLAGFTKKTKKSAEASLKYLILGALATGLFLYGAALIYGSTGTTDLSEIGQILAQDSYPETQGAQIMSTETAAELSGQTEQWADIQTQIQASDFVGASESITELRLSASRLISADSLRPIVSDSSNFITLAPLAFIGMLLILVAFCFKIAAVPFHMWAPDVYSGAPTPAVGFMATAVKAAGFAGLLRVFMLAFFEDVSRTTTTGWVPILFGLALLTIVVGNFAAIIQKDLRRMLAYSSIAHAGYILVGIVAAGFSGNQGFLYSVIYYLIAYTFATLGAFGVLTYFGRKGEEVRTYDDLNGLGQKHPMAGFAMIVFMLSAAGIPPLAGFFAKFLVFKSAIDAGAAGGAPGTMLFILVAAGLLASVAGIFYYLRVIVHMYMKESSRVIRPLRSWATAVALIVCVAGTIGFGVLPNHITELSNLAAHRIADSPQGPAAVPFPVPSTAASAVTPTEH